MGELCSSGHYCYKESADLKSKVVAESDKVSPQPPFLQAKQPQFPQLLLIRLTLHQLCCPSLDTLQHLNVSLVVRGPKLNTGFEGHDHFPTPAGHAIFDTSQNAIGFLGHLGTLLAHIQAAVNQHPQVLFCVAAFQPLFPKPVALHGVAVAQVQDLALGLVKPHTIGPSPSIQPSLPTLKQINTPTQLGVICKLTEGALDPFVQIIDKDIKQDWPQHRSLGNTACDRPPTGVNSIHHHSLGPAVQPVLYPAKSTPVQAMSSQFLQENAERCSSPFTISVTLCCTLSCMPMSLPYWEAQNWTQHPRCGLTSEQEPQMYSQTGVQSNAWTHSRKPSSLSGVRLPRPPQTNKELNTEHYMSHLKSIPSR
ncbi:LOW QUALITY PROTEIN: hypothetical protein QYF61_012541, partial [Mycteria americana]